MDTSEQTTLETIKQTKRRRRSLEEKRRIVEETLESGASVARVARQHAVNANQVFYWRKKYREGRLGKGRSSNLLPVTVSDIPWSKQVRGASSRGPLGLLFNYSIWLALRERRAEARIANSFQDLAVLVVQIETSKLPHCIGSLTCGNKFISY